jgi:hypothetical protein
MWTASMPSSSIASDSSTLGIIPPEMTPDAICSRASAAVSLGMRVETSFLSRSTPGTLETRNSFAARSFAATRAATVSALMLKTFPPASPPSEPITGTNPTLASFSSAAVSTETMSPTRPRSTGSGPAPVMTFGGRRTASTRPADTPVVQSAGTSASRIAAATSTETCPASAIFITSSVSGSVTRRPPTMVGSSPSRRPSSVAWGPAPWTMQTRMPAERNSPTAAPTLPARRVRSAASSPPTFTTNHRPAKSESALTATAPAP